MDGSACCVSNYGDDVADLLTRCVGVQIFFLILQIQRHLAGNTYELCTFKWICSLNRSKQIDGARPQGR